VTDATIYGMTLPYEQYLAINNTREFLFSLMDPQRTPKAPRYLRERARQLLKHFPTEYDANELVKAHTEWLHEINTKKTDVERGNPVEYSPRYGGWIFWDETSTQPSKPYLTRRDAQDALNRYIQDLG